MPETEGPRARVSRFDVEGRDVSLSVKLVGNVWEVCEDDHPLHTDDDQDAAVLIAETFVSMFDQAEALHREAAALFTNPPAKGVRMLRMPVQLSADEEDEHEEDELELQPDVESESEAPPGESVKPPERNPQRVPIDGDPLFCEEDHGEDKKISLNEGLVSWATHRAYLCLDHHKERA